MGSPDFAVPSLEKLVNNEKINIKTVISQPDRRRGRGQKLHPTPVKARAQDLNKNVHTTSNVNEDSFINLIKNLDPEVIVVVAFGQILKKPILQIPDKGCINLHASLLPEYRGASPIHQAVINGDNKTGVTTMFMDEGLDTGDIIYQKEIPIEKTDTVGIVHDKLAKKGGKLLLKTLLDLKNNNVPQIPQDREKGSYTTKIDKKMGKINWHKSADKIYNLVRGVNPYPGAYTYLYNKLLKIWWVDIIDNNKIISKPGTVVSANQKEGLIVQSGSGLLRITKLQPAGSSKMKDKEYLRGHEIKKNTILGRK